MFIVTENGRRITVPDYRESDEEWCPFQQTVGLYTDDTILKDVWILELNHRDFFARKRDFELEFVKDIKFDHEPTKEEILWAMSANGCTRGDIAIVRKGVELDMDMDED